MAAYTAGADNEPEEVRIAAAKTVTDAENVAEAAIQPAITDRDGILAERTADMRWQIEQVKADAQTQVKDLQDQVDAAEVEAEQLLKTMPGELADATSAAARAETDKVEVDRAAELDHATVALQQAQFGPVVARARGTTEGRKPKMTPQLVAKAQRMYDSRRFTMAEIAQSCAVSPTTVYRHIRTGQNTAQ